MPLLLPCCPAFCHPSAEGEDLKHGAFSILLSVWFRPLICTGLYITREGGAHKLGGGSEPSHALPLHTCNCLRGNLPNRAYGFSQFHREFYTSAFCPSLFFSSQHEQERLYPSHSLVGFPVSKNVSKAQGVFLAQATYLKCMYLCFLLTSPHSTFEALEFAGIFDVNCTI